MELLEEMRIFLEESEEPSKPLRSSSAKLWGAHSAVSRMCTRICSPSCGSSLFSRSCRDSKQLENVPCATPARWAIGVMEAPA
jgi:hypothetical protein